MRNRTRAGVSETVAMRLTEHKTASVFDRYDMVSGNDLGAAIGKLAARPGTVWRQSGDRARQAAGESRGIAEGMVEAPSGFEPEMEVLRIPPSLQIRPELTASLISWLPGTMPSWMGCGRVNRPS